MWQQLSEDAHLHHPERRQPDAAQSALFTLGGTKCVCPFTVATVQIVPAVAIVGEASVLYDEHHVFEREGTVSVVAGLNREELAVTLNARIRKVGK